MIIGIYGRIGAGKSLIAKRIADFNQAEIIDLDLVAKDLLNNNDKLIDDLRNNPITTKAIDNNEINKREMTKLIFNKYKTNDEVSHIVWPYIKREVLKMIKNKNNVVIEAATLPTFEINQIDKYFYIKRRLTLFQLIKLTKEKKKSLFQLLSIMCIQWKKNKKYIKNSYIIKNAK